jgi:hypothetical protein
MLYYLGAAGKAWFPARQLLRDELDAPILGSTFIRVVRSDRLVEAFA